MLIIDRTLITLLFLVFCSTAISQDSKKTITLTQAEALVLYDKEQKAKVYFEEMQTPGVIVEDGKMIFSKEAQKLINNSNYRAEVYKSVYTFEDVNQSLAKSEMQKAYWQMINIYPDNKKKVLQYIYAYDNVFPTDKVVISSFYTYAFFDPKITTIVNGKPDVHRPDLFEEHLRRTKEIVGYIKYFREENKKTK